MAETPFMTFPEFAAERQKKHPDESRLDTLAWYDEFLKQGIGIHGEGTYKDWLASLSPSELIEHQSLETERDKAISYRALEMMKRVDVEKLSEAGRVEHMRRLELMQKKVIQHLPKL